MLKIRDEIDLQELEKFGFNDMSKYNISEELEDDNIISDNGNYNYNVEE